MSWPKFYRINYFIYWSGVLYSSSSSNTTKWCMNDNELALDFPLSLWQSFISQVETRVMCCKRLLTLHYILIYSCKSVANLKHVPSKQALYHQVKVKWEKKWKFYILNSLLIENNPQPKQKKGWKIHFLKKSNMLMWSVEREKKAVNKYSFHGGGSSALQTPFSKGRICWSTFALQYSLLIHS